MGKVCNTLESTKLNFIFCRLKRVEVAVCCKQLLNEKFLHLTYVT